MRFYLLSLTLFSLVLISGCVQSQLPVNNEALEQEALEQIEAEARQGDVNAQYQLGVRYGHGEGVDHNSDEAKKWVRLAAEKGHPQAQFMLGQAYFYGEGVKVDYVQAYRWLYRSSRHEKFNNPPLNLKESEDKALLRQLLLKLQQKTTPAQRLQAESLALKEELT